MLTTLFAIARNTFTETIRQPIYGVLMWVCVLLLVLNPALANFSLESGGDVKIAKDVGLATLMLFGLFCAVFSATGVITREIESHTVLTVVSKPVARPVFLLGKYLGVTVAVLLAYYFLSLVFFLTIRHGTMPTASDKYDLPVLIFSCTALAVALVASVFGNFVYGWNFVTTLTAWVVPLMTVAFGLVLTVSGEWQVQSPLTDFGDGQLLYATLLCFCGVLVLTAFAVALATRFSQVVTLVLCIGVYIVGLLSDHWFGEPSSALHLLYWAIPNFQFFWVGDALTQGQPIPPLQVLQVAAYAAVYSLGVVSLGVALFQTREVS